MWGGGVCRGRGHACARALACRRLCLGTRVPGDAGIGTLVCQGSVHACACVVMCLCLHTGARVCLRIRVWVPVCAPGSGYGCTHVPKDWGIGARVCEGSVYKHV